MEETPQNSPTKNTTDACAKEIPLQEEPPKKQRGRPLKVLSEAELAELKANHPFFNRAYHREYHQRYYHNTTRKEIFCPHCNLLLLNHYNLKNHIKKIQNALSYDYAKNKNKRNDKNKKIRKIKFIIEN